MSREPLPLEEMASREGGESWPLSSEEDPMSLFYSLYRQLSGGQPRAASSREGKLASPDYSAGTSTNSHHDQHPAWKVHSPNTSSCDQSAPANKPQSSSMVKIIDIQRHRTRKPEASEAQPPERNSLGQVEELSSARFVSDGQPASRNQSHPPSPAGNVRGNPSLQANERWPSSSLAGGGGSSNQQQSSLSGAASSNLRASTSAAGQQARQQQHLKQHSGETLSSFESDYDLLVYLGETETEDIIETERSCDYQDQTWRQSICDGASLAPTIDESLSELTGFAGSPNNPNQLLSSLQSTPAPLEPSNAAEAANLNADLRLTPTELSLASSPLGSINRRAYYASSQLAQPTSGARHSYQPSVEAFSAARKQQVPARNIQRSDLCTESADECDNEVSLVFDNALLKRLSKHLPGLADREPETAESRHLPAGGMKASRRGPAEEANSSSELDRLLAEMSQTLDLDSLARFDPHASSSTSQTLSKFHQRQPVSRELPAAKRAEPRNSTISSAGWRAPTSGRQALAGGQPGEPATSSASILDEYDGASRILEQMIGGRLAEQPASEREEARKMSTCSSSLTTTEPTSVVAAPKQQRPRREPSLYENRSVWAQRRKSPVATSPPEAASARAVRLESVASQPEVAAVISASGFRSAPEPQRAASLRKRASSSCSSGSGSELESAERRPDSQPPPPPAVDYGDEQQVIRVEAAEMPPLELSDLEEPNRKQAGQMERMKRRTLSSMRSMRCRLNDFIAGDHKRRSSLKRSSGSQAGGALLAPEELATQLPQAPPKPPKRSSSFGSVRSQQSSKRLAETPDQKQQPDRKSRRGQEMRRQESLGSQIRASLSRSKSRFVDKFLRAKRAQSQPNRKQEEPTQPEAFLELFQPSDISRYSRELSAERKAAPEEGPQEKPPRATSGHSSSSPSSLSGLEQSPRRPRRHSRRRKANERRSSSLLSIKRLAGKQAGNKPEAVEDLDSLRRPSSRGAPEREPGRRKAATLSPLPVRRANDAEYFARVRTPSPPPTGNPARVARSQSMRAFEVRDSPTESGSGKEHPSKDKRTVSFSNLQARRGPSTTTFRPVSALAKVGPPEEASEEEEARPESAVATIQVPATPIAPSLIEPEDADGERGSARASTRSPSLFRGIKSKCSELLAGSPMMRRKERREVCIGPAPLPADVPTRPPRQRSKSVSADPNKKSGASAGSELNPAKPIESAKSSLTLQPEANQRFDRRENRASNRLTSLAHHLRESAAEFFSPAGSHQDSRRSKSAAPMRQPPRRPAGATSVAPEQAGELCAWRPVIKVAEPVQKRPLLANLIGKSSQAKEEWQPGEEGGKLSQQGTGAAELESGARTARRSLDTDSTWDSSGAEEEERGQGEECRLPAESASEEAAPAEAVAGHFQATLVEPGEADAESRRQASAELKRNRTAERAKKLVGRAEVLNGAADSNKCHSLEPNNNNNHDNNNNADVLASDCCRLEGAAESRQREGLQQAESVERKQRSDQKVDEQIRSIRSGQQEREICKTPFKFNGNLPSPAQVLQSNSSQREDYYKEDEQAERIIGESEEDLEALLELEGREEGGGGACEGRADCKMREGASGGQENRLSVYENVGQISTERSSPPRAWRKPPATPLKPAHLRSGAPTTAASRQKPASSPPDSPANWSLTGEPQPAAPNPAALAARLELQQQAFRAGEPAERKQEAPRRKLVSMTSIIQEPNDELMFGSTSLPGARSQSRRDSNFANDDDDCNYNDYSNSSDGSFAAAAANRRRLLDRLQPPNKPLPPPPTITGAQPALARESSSLVKRMARNFDRQAAGSGSARAQPTSFEELSRSESSWYDAKAGEELDEAEVADFLRNLEPEPAGRKPESRAMVSIRELSKTSGSLEGISSVSSGLDPFVTVAESTIEEDLAEAQDEEASQQAEEDDDTLNDGDQSLEELAGELEREQAEQEAEGRPEEPSRQEGPEAGAASAATAQLGASGARAAEIDDASQSVHKRHLSLNPNYHDQQQQERREQMQRQMSSSAELEQNKQTSLRFATRNSSIDNTFKTSLNNIIGRRSSQQQPEGRIPEVSAVADGSKVKASANNMTTAPVTHAEPPSQPEAKPRPKSEASIKCKELRGLTKYCRAILGHGRALKGAKRKERLVVNQYQQLSSSSCSSTNSSGGESSSSDDEDQDQGRRPKGSSKEADDKQLVRAAKKCSRLYEELERILASRLAKEQQAATSGGQQATEAASKAPPGESPPLEVQDEEEEVEEDEEDDLASFGSQGELDALGGLTEDQVSLSSSSVSSESIPEIRQRQRLQKLYKIVNEIYSTETTFVDTLRLLNEDFRSHVLGGAQAPNGNSNAQDSLQSSLSLTSLPSGRSGANIPAEQLNGLLKHLPQLQALNESLLAELRLARNQWPRSQKIAHVLVKIGPFLKHYSTYMREYNSMSEQFQEAMKKYPQFGERVRSFEASPRCQRLRVQHHLLKPIQRIPQYRLLLQEYLDHLKPDHVDYEDAVSALEVVSKVAEHANQSMSEGANFAKLLALQAKIVGKQKNIVQPGRVFVKEGELMKVCRKQIQPRRFVLLNDALLYLTPIQASDILYLNKELPLDDCTISIPEAGSASSQENSEREFNVCTKIRAFALIGKSKLERDDWIRAIRSAVEEHTAKRRSFCITNKEPFLAGAQQQVPAAKPLEEPQAGQLLGEKAPLWTPDSRVTMCQLCTSSFSAIFRRHHCRACGKVVCSACSSNKAPLIYLKCRSARVCDQCFDILKANIHLYYLPTSPTSSHNQNAGNNPNDSSSTSSSVNEQELRRLDELFRTLLKSQFVRHARLRGLSRLLKF